MFASTLSLLNLQRLWLFNLGLVVLYISLSVGFPFIKGSVLEYPNVKPAAFNGTVSPIAYVPNWLNWDNMNKTLRYENIAASEFIQTPFYDPETIANSDARDKVALLARATYMTTYMGSYRMNFQEFDGSHLGVDIRAPLGTPVLSIANGVVTKVVNSENADGKYIVVRHDGVSFGGLPVANYYSAYLHLESTNVTEGSLVTKGQQIGKVWMTGITTTPHLHFQIDKQDAPFHSYWPYSFKDLRDAKLDFFEAVNVGFGKENAMKYTVHPMDFVQNLTGASSVTSAPPQEIKVAASIPAQPQTFVTAVVVTPPVTPIPQNTITPTQVTPQVVLPTPTSTSTVTFRPAPTSESSTSPQIDIVAQAQATPIFSAPVLPDFNSAPPTRTSASQAVKSSQAYIDVSKTATYARAAQYLKDRAVPVLSNESVFRPRQHMTRREAVLYLAWVFGIESQQGVVSPFADVPADDAALWYIGTLQARGVIKAGWLFRPNDAITKTELVALMLRITNDYDSSKAELGEKWPMRTFINTTRFSPAAVRADRAVTRSDAARMIQLWGTLGQS